MTRKLICPKCQSDAFKLTLDERQETPEKVQQVNKMAIVMFLNITCTKCGWNQRLTRAENG